MDIWCSHKGSTFSISGLFVELIQEGGLLWAGAGTAGPSGSDWEARPLSASAAVPRVSKHTSSHGTISQRLQGTKSLMVSPVSPEST